MVPRKTMDNREYIVIVFIVLTHSEQITHIQMYIILFVSYT